ncbi:MAG: DNA gyrase subunit A, partial [Thermoplasmata archaeon]|nr:DNA gyrase subunit A [Thermoplasmata archaeon]
LVQMETKEEDYVIQTFATRTHDNVLFFTTLGRVYQLKAYELPEGSRHSKGKAVINLLPKLKDKEKVQTLLPLRDMATEGSLLFGSRKGIVKRTELDMFQNIRTNGIQAVLLDEGDQLVDVALVAPEDKEVILATHSGQLVRFPIAEVRGMGRSTYGVIGARLSDPKSDYIVTMAPVRGERPFLLTITSTGFGKRSLTTDYRETKRGAKGVRTIRTGGRNGGVVAVLPVREDDEILVTTQGGITIRMAVKGIRAQGRNTMGVRVMRLDEGDEVKDALVLPAGLIGPDDEKPGETPPDAPVTAPEPAPEPDDAPDLPDVDGDDADDEEDDDAPTPGA